MEPSTELDAYVLEQVEEHLGQYEKVEACAYLVDSVAPQLGQLSKAKAWFAVLTNERLIRVQTRRGGLKPRRENLGVEFVPLDDIDAAFLGATLVIRMSDGSELDLEYVADDKRLSSQPLFMHRIMDRFGNTQASMALADELTAFDRGLREMTPHVVFTPMLVALNVCVFGLMVFKGVSFMSPQVPDLLTWGANFGPLTTGGEYWRLLTSTFVHIGALHIAFNMWVLWDIGRFVERLVGNVGFICLYLVSGLLASIASTWFNPLIVSAGASGAVFGVAGALVGIVLIDRGAIPTKRLAQLRSSVGSFLMYNLVFGFTIPNIDQAAHIGGLFAGFLCGLVLARSASKEGHPQRLRRGLTVALIGAIAIPSLALALPSDVADAQRTLDDFVAVEARVIDAIQAAANKEVSDAEFAILLENKVLPDWRESRQSLAKLSDLPKAMQKRVDALERYAQLREEGWTLTLQAIQKNDEALAKQGLAKQAEAEKVIKELSQTAKSKD